MTQWEVSGCPDAKARQPNGYFSPLDCGVLPQPSRHDQQDARDGEKHRDRQPSESVRQDLEGDSKANYHHRKPERRKSEQEVRREDFLARVAEEK